jgi:glutathione peroxidase-family protein
MAFTLQDLPNYAEFTSLFERYRLESVEIVLHPFNTFTETATTASNGACGGFLHSFVDYNDVGVVTANQSSINSMRERPSYRTMNVASQKPYTWALRPRVAVPAYASTGFSGYSNMAAPWIDSISTDVEHYGMKWLFEIANASPLIQFLNFKLEFRYTLSFTDVK